MHLLLSTGDDFSTQNRQEEYDAGKWKTTSDKVKAKQYMSTTKYKFKMPFKGYNLNSSGVKLPAISIPDSKLNRESEDKADEEDLEKMIEMAQRPLTSPDKKLETILKEQHQTTTSTIQPSGDYLSVTNNSKTNNEDENAPNLKQSYEQYEKGNDYGLREVSYLLGRLIEKKYDAGMKMESVVDQIKDPSKASSSKSLLSKQSDLFKTTDQESNAEAVLQLYRGIGTKQGRLADPISNNKLKELVNEIEKRKHKNYDDPQNQYNMSYKFEKLYEERAPKKEKAHSKTENEATLLSEYVMNKMNKRKTTFNQKKHVDEYYKLQENFQDDIPFDLYNMVQFAKRANSKFKKPKIKDVSASLAHSLSVKNITKSDSLGLFKTFDQDEIGNKHEMGAKSNGKGNVSQKSSGKRLKSLLSTQRSEKSMNKESSCSVLPSGLSASRSTSILPYYNLQNISQEELREPKVQQIKQRYDKCREKLQYTEGAKLFKMNMKRSNERLPYFLEGVKLLKPKTIQNRLSTLFVS